VPSPAKGVPARFVSVGPAAAAKASSEGWRLCLRPNKMQEPEDKIHDATNPLCGFGGRQIVALGKITMPVTFDFVHNTRTKQVVFDIVDMEYNAIIGRGTLNAFEAILHPAYLCMKIPSEQGPIAVHGSQEAARKV
jgi:hypothetical protein